MNSHIVSESLSQIQATFAEIQFFIGIVFLLAHTVDVYTTVSVMHSNLCNTRSMFTFLGTASWLASTHFHPTECSGI